MGANHYIYIQRETVCIYNLSVYSCICMYSSVQYASLVQVKKYSSNPTTNRAHSAMQETEFFEFSSSSVDAQGAGRVLRESGASLIISSLAPWHYSSLSVCFIWREPLLNIALFILLHRSIYSLACSTIAYCPCLACSWMHMLSLLAVIHLHCQPEIFIIRTDLKTLRFFVPLSNSFFFWFEKN